MNKKHRRKLLDLSNQRAQQVTAMEQALEAGDQEAFDKADAAIKDLDAQIANVQRMIAAEEATPVDVPDNARSPEAAPADPTGNVRASREYSRAFCRALRNRVTPATARGDEYAPLMNALQETGGSPEGSDGGFLVPVDLQTRINELRRQFVSLRDLVRVEPVNTLSGYRVLDTAPTKGFTSLAEMGEIQQDDQPKFSRYEYKVTDYGLIVPISNDLLADNDAGLLEYLARWLAKKAVLTENDLILKLLATIEAGDPVAAGGELAAIKKVLNVTLDPDIALNAAILCNQTSYNVLDTLEDANKRGLMQPDVTAGTGCQIKGKHITAVANRMLADAEAGSPIYIGSFADAITLFDRQVMEVVTTNIGGKAWSTNSTEARAIMRLDCKLVDKDAVAALKLAAGKTAGE